MKKRAMKASKASHVKVAGHQNETCFAHLIHGETNHENHTAKGDVTDQQGRRHSVKSGTWWQIFLYGKQRFANNTVFLEMGAVSQLMIECLDAYPPQFADYKADKSATKARLQIKMRLLLTELTKPAIYPQFINKALFDGDAADYLSIFMGDKKTVQCVDREFHIFHKDDVVAAFMQHVFLVNSKAVAKNQTSDLKVIFKSRLHNDTNIGEIEDRHDSEAHYQQMKFRLNAARVFDILTTAISCRQQLNQQLITYGKASELFSI